MRFVGIDIGGEHHAIAAVSEDGAVLLRPTFFTEDAVGYGRLHELLVIRTIAWSRWKQRGTIGAICSRFWWAKASRLQP